MVIFSKGGMLTQNRIGVASISHSIGPMRGSKESYVKSRIFAIHNLFSAIILRNLLEMKILIS